MGKIVEFEKIDTYQKLIEELVDRVNRKHSTKDRITRYFYHYTTTNAVLSILKSSKWFMNSPKNMNDGLELIHIEENEVDNLFFSSFVSEGKENMGMWSMYSQPWDKGVMIKIPIKMMKEWSKVDGSVYIADVETKKVLDGPINAEIKLHFVAYTNADFIEGEEPEELVCEGYKNTLLTNILSQKEIIGYIKDKTWSYENEIRLRVETKIKNPPKAIIMEIPKEILDSLEFVIGPKYEGDLLETIRKEVDESFPENRVQKSLFYNKLNWVYCDDCKYNRNNDV